MVTNYVAKFAKIYTSPSFSTLAFLNGLELLYADDPSTSTENLASFCLVTLKFISFFGIQQASIDAGISLTAFDR